MAVPDPTALYFQYIDGAGSAEISYERTIDSADWQSIIYNDIHLWASGNHRRSLDSSA